MKRSLRFGKYPAPYRKYLDRIWEHARMIAQPGEGLHHDGIEHCERVDENLARLVHSCVGGRYSHEERFLLSASCALHDVWKDTDTVGASDHGHLASHHVQNMRLDPVPKTFFSYVASIIGIHDQGHIMQVPFPRVHMFGDRVALPRLALLFKIADMLDCSNRRVNLPRAQATNAQMTSKDQGRLGISDWEARDVDGRVLHIILDPDSNQQMHHSFNAVRMMTQELQQHYMPLSLLDLPTGFVPILVATAPEARKEEFNQRITQSSITSVQSSLRPKYPLARNANLLIVFLPRGTSRNRVLLRWHKDWRQYLFPAVPSIIPLDENKRVAQLLVHSVFDLDRTMVRVLGVGPRFVSVKTSKRSSVLTEYTFQMAVVKLTQKAPKCFKKRLFMWHGGRFRWFGLKELDKDRKVTDGNEEVIANLRSLHLGYTKKP